MSAMIYIEDTKTETSKLIVWRTKRRTKIYLGAVTKNGLGEWKAIFYPQKRSLPYISFEAIEAVYRFMEEKQIAEKQQRIQEAKIKEQQEQLRKIKRKK